MIYNGWISFDDTGAILISEQLDPVDRINMNVFDDMKIHLTEENKKVFGISQKEYI